jgi:phenylalanine-4-hydroxylase
MEKQFVPTGGAFMIWRKSSFCFSGPADANSFDMITHMPSSTTIKAKQTAERDDCTKW